MKYTLLRTSGAKILLVMVLVVAFFSIIYFSLSIRQNEHQQMVQNNNNLILDMLQTRELEMLLLLRDYNYLDSVHQLKLMDYDVLSENYHTIYRQFHALLTERKNLQQSLKTYQDRIQVLLNEIFTLQQHNKLLLQAVDSLMFILQNAQKPQLHSSQRAIQLRELNLLQMKSQPANIKTRTGFASFTKNRKKANAVIITFDKTSPFVQFDLGLTQLYFRIADPHGNILPYSEVEPSFFEYNGDSILFSHVEEVVFSSELMPLRIIYKPIWPLQSGIYWVYAFCDGIKIAESSFEVY